METKKDFFKYKNYIIDLSLVDCAYVPEINKMLVVCMKNGKMVEILYEYEHGLQSAYRKLCNALLKYQTQ
jgi:hypothetical protein